MRHHLAAVLLTLVAFALAAPLCAETYGNFHTLGVVVDPPEGYAWRDLGQIRAFLLEPGGRREVHPFVQVASALEPRGYFATSLFDLKPNTAYTVEVEFYDRRGRQLLATQTETGRTRPEPVLPQTARALYVSPQGDDRNPGTAAKPFRTVKAALAAVTPGTTVLLREGRYYEGDLQLPKGAAAAPIVLLSYPGDKPILDCAYPELESGVWRTEGGGIYSAPLAGMTWNVTVEEKKTGAYSRLYPLRTLEELQRQESGGMTFARLGFTGAYYWDGKRIHLRLPQGRIEDYLVHASRFESALTAEGADHIFVDGLEFRHSEGNVIKLRDSSENVFQHGRVLYCNAGLLIKGDSNNNTVQDNTFTDDTHHWSFEYAKTDRGWRYHNYVETGAVCVDGRYSGRGLVVRRNRISHMFDGAHLGPWVEIKARTSETDFYDNDLREMSDDFLEIDGFSRNVRVFSNTMRGALTGVSIAQALDGPTWIVRNVIADCGVCQATQAGEHWGYPIKSNGGDFADTLGTGTVLLYHNTAYTSDPGSAAFLVKGAMWRTLRFRNNVWCGKVVGLSTFLPMIWPVDWDYDDLYTASGPLAKLGGNEYRTLEALRDGRAVMPLPRFGPAGFGRRLLSVDPKLTDPDHGDYRLAPGSPLIDAGVVIPGINDRSFQGRAPDLGAFETAAK